MGIKLKISARIMGARQHGGDSIAHCAGVAENSLVQYKNKNKWNRSILYSLNI